MRCRLYEGLVLLALAVVPNSSPIFCSPVHGQTKATKEIETKPANRIGTPNDPDFPMQWSLHNIGQKGGIIDADIDAPEAWERTTGSTATVVAILDTGVDITHPDLYLNIWLNREEIPKKIRRKLVDSDGDGLFTFRDLNDPKNAKFTTDVNKNGYIDGGDLLDDPNWKNGRDEDGNRYPDDLVGWDYVDNDNDPRPAKKDLHGTRASLLIGGIGNNCIGGAGLNWKVRMVPIRVRLGGGRDIVNSRVSAGLDYGIQSKASIVDLGFRGKPRASADEFSQEIFDAIQRTQRAGQLLVTAAGNGSRNTDRHPWYPQSYAVDNIITSAALNGNGDQLALSNVTNWGAKSVDIAVTTTNGATSRALALTTGVAALLKSQHPDWTYEQIINRIQDTVDLEDSLTGKTKTGGRLNAAAALGVQRRENMSPRKKE